ncbi:TPA: RHS repeat-associated core domain-containing protein, partial [Citrobacter amalonaticus]|nr:RHS repeat protein [Citrobacter amalonaticus]
EKFQQEANVTFPPELVAMVDNLEAELRRGELSEASRTWLAQCGLTPEQMKNQLEPEYTPERKIHLYHCDHRGLPLALIDVKGQIAWHAEFDEWGNILREDNPHNLEQLIRLPGQQWDKETGLYYNRHRYYDPAQGRYITQDPIGLNGGWNLYSYVFNNPIKFIDPRGLDIWLEGAAPSEQDLHQSVNVGDPNGVYDSYSYGMSDFPHGEVYKDISHGGVIVDYKKTNAAQDKIFKEMMDKKIGERSYYGYDDICRSWSQRQFKSAPGESATPPERKGAITTMGFGASSSKGSSTTTNTGTSQ